MAGRTRAPGVLGAAISCIFVIAGCSGDGPSSKPAASQSFPSATVSAPTALEVFEELRKKADRIFRERDFAGMKGVYDPAGPSWHRVIGDLKVMRKAGVTFRSLDRILETRVVEESATRLVVREELISDGRFVYANGKSAPSKRDPQRQVVKWTLKSHGGEFLIFDSIIMSSRDAKT